MYLTKWLSATAVVLLASTAVADTIATGQVMQMNPTNKTFRLQSDKRTFKLSEGCVIRRDTAESVFKKTELKNGDYVDCYSDQAGGLLIKYILVRDGSTKLKHLAVGTLKSLDREAATIELNAQTSATYVISEAKVRLNNKNSKMANLKVGDKLLFINYITAGKQTLADVMVERK